MFKFFRKEKEFKVPAVSMFSGLFSSFFSRNSDYVDRYKDWVSLCIRLIAQECYSAKLRIYRKKKNGSVEEDYDNELAKLIENPNPEMSFNEILEGVSSFLDLDGNAYIYKAKVNNKPLELWLLRSDWMGVIPDTTGEKLIKYYQYKNGKNAVKIEPDQIIHFKNFNPKFYDNVNPYKGVGVVQLSLNTILEDETIKEWNRKFFEQGAFPSGVLEYEGTLSDEERIRLEKKWKQNQEGIANANKVPFLQGGLKFKKTGLSQKELAFIDQRKLDRDDILALFGVPKGIILSDDVNLANAKMSLWNFTRFVIRPRLKKIEDVLNAKLVKEIDPDLFIEFDDPVPDDREAIINEYDKGCNRWLTVNDIRREEGLPELEGGDIIPPINERNEQIKQIKTKASDFSEIERDKRGEKAWKAMIEVQSMYEDKYKIELSKYFFGLRQRVLKRIMQKKKAQEDFDYVDREEEVKILFDIITPLQREYFEKEGRRAMKELGVDKEFSVNEEVEKYIEKYDLKLAGSLTDTTIKEIKRIIRENQKLGTDELAEKISKYFDYAEKYRAERIARSETIRTSNAGMEEAWKQSEVVKEKEWYTAKDERVCPYCKEMNGKTKPLGKSFKKKGSYVLDLKLDYRTITEPPLHSQCRCVLLPVVSN